MERLKSTALHRRGFTLIELSIVLVIIGLIVGGVLVGRDLIKAAELRSLISQKEKFETAVNTFRAKYNAYPGDMSPTLSAQLGFFTFTGSGAGSYPFGNNNGFIDGAGGDALCAYECGAFWRHLSDALLIAPPSSTNAAKPLDPLATNSYPGAPTGETFATPFTLSLYMPASKVRGFWGVDTLNHFDYSYTFAGLNINRNAYYLIPQGTTAAPYNNPTLTPIEAYNIDIKIDDGLPNTGKMLDNSYDSQLSTYHWWSAAVTSSSLVCTTGGATKHDKAATYNVSGNTGGTQLTCQPLFIW